MTSRCGHLGVTATPNVAELKRRLAPAVAELEDIGFLEPARPEERYLKVGKGIWRIRFRRAGTADSPAPATKPTPVLAVDERPEPGRALVMAFYRAWAPGAVRAHPVGTGAGP